MVSHLPPSGQTLQQTLYMVSYLPAGGHAVSKSLALGPHHGTQDLVLDGVLQRQQLQPRNIFEHLFSRTSRTATTCICRAPQLQPEGPSSYLKSLYKLPGPL